MPRPSLLAILAPIALATLAACGADNPNFCESPPCAVPIDAPSPQSCTGNGADPACRPTDPICTDNVCGGACSTDTECSARTDGNVVCLQPTGDCVVCDESDAQAAPGSAEDECRLPAMAVCDAQTHSCRACEEHAECASGVCDAGTCVAASNVVYMKMDGSDTDCGATPAAGCKTMQVAIGELTATRKYLVMAPSPGTFYLARMGGDRADFSNKTAHVIGYGAFVRRSDDGQVIHVRGSSSVIIEGLTVERATGGSGSAVLNDATLELRRAILRNNDQHGVHSTTGTVRVIRSTVTANRGGGVNLTGGNFAMVNNFIFDNGGGSAPFGGVSLTTTTTGNLFEFNTIAFNTTPAAFVDGVNCTGTQVLRNNIIVGSSGRLRVNAGTTCSFTFNLYGPDGVLTGNGNMMVADPAAFMFTSTSDLHVAMGTVATGKAQATGLTADTMFDIDGNSRQTGGATVEVGADEIP